MEHQKYLEFPNDRDISTEAIDFIKKLITKSENRLGKNGSDELKAHAWLKGTSWENIKNGKSFDFL